MFCHLVAVTAVLVAAMSPSSVVSAYEIEGDVYLGEPLDLSDEVMKSYDVTMTFLEDKVWDVIVVTDDWGLYDDMGTKEDTLVMDALKKLGRTTTRASFMDHSFDWHAGRVVVIRSAWAKVRMLLLCLSVKPLRKNAYLIAYSSRQNKVLAYG